ncbi:MAG TPA: expansin EXLX1 family cellulose-binding protein [Polyangiaceae bacterium]
MSSSGAPAHVGGAAGVSVGAGGTSGAIAASGSGGGPMASGGMSVSVGGSSTSSAGTGSSSAGATSSSAGASMTDPCASVTCGTGQTCMNGTCMCKTGMLCSDGCFDTQNDLNHCGGCSTKCASDGACVSGKCVNPTCTPDTEVRQGHVTHYSLATSMVACHYPTSTLPQYYGAMNEYDWNNAGVCGACVEITNGGSKVVVEITDQCPYKGNEQWCKPGSHHIDLNNAANSALNANSNPAVTWKYVPCTTTGNLKYYFDKAVQQYYLAVTPMNAKNVVAKMEVQVKDQWTALTRNTNNMYELTTGAGTGALTFRLTDIYNHVITDTVTMAADKVVDGTKQFAACP